MTHYFGDDLIESLGPVMETDQSGDLAKFLRTLGVPFGQIEDLARDTEDGHPGWSVALDVDRAPADALPWLAQFAGVVLTREADHTQQRQEIRDATGQRRGTVASIVQAAQRHLTGNKYVAVVERADGSAYKLRIVTRTAETPNAAAVEAAIREQKPAGIVLDYATTAGMTWDEATSSWDASTGSWDASL